MSKETKIYSLLIKSGIYYFCIYSDSGRKVKVPILEMSKASHKVIK